MFNWMSYTGKQAIREEANRGVLLSEGQQYQQGWVKLGKQKKFLLGSEHWHSYIFLSWMTFSMYLQFRLLWVSQGCFSSLTVKKDQRKPWMLLGNQQFSPGKRVDCYLDSSPNISYRLWLACSPGTFPEQGCGEDGKKAIPMATVPSLHHADPLLFHWLLCNYSWFTSTRESSRVMSDTPDNHQSDWFQAWAKLKDYRSPLRLRSAHHEANRFVSNFCLLLSSSFISLAPGTGLYGPGRGPGSFASSSPTRPGRQLRLCLEVRAVCELGRLHAEVNTSVRYLPEKPWVVIPPSGLPLLVSMGTWGGTGRQSGATWLLLLPNEPFWKHQNRCWPCWPEAPPRCLDDSLGGPFKPQGQCWLCRSTRWERTGAIHSREVWSVNI